MQGLWLALVGSPDTLLLTTIAVVALLAALLTTQLAAQVRRTLPAAGQPWTPDLLGRIAHNRYLRLGDPDAPGRPRPRAPGVTRAFA
ncbi:DUF6412 domain-containing protein [Crossiella cryophila]|uniref:Putative DCC family thiol-disulfide oxidoreductase YuxK n=1 Tax=Crossiella cryophila TaxID=43355 RepID=A0A7W7CKU7_9PSEU|nr:DUF6412 domain-containing protein [Crossiella cryophila]MBB4681319.1 putative DCC family thiol-disulfide oxidoreductase YuxK [Crossiella cryophila]